MTTTGATENDHGVPIPEPCEIFTPQIYRSVFGIAPNAATGHQSAATEVFISDQPPRLSCERVFRAGNVAKPAPAELAGMFEVMGYLEALCAGLCAAMMTAAERDALDAQHSAMAGIVRAGDATGYAEANDAFHTAIYDGAHNGYLREITVSTRQRLQPFRRAQFGARGRLAQSHTEHGLIVEAILRGDRGEAEAAMRQHIAIVGDAYERLSRG